MTKNLFSYISLAWPKNIHRFKKTIANLFSNRKCSSAQVRRRKGGSMFLQKDWIHFDILGRMKSPISILQEQFVDIFWCHQHRDIQIFRDMGMNFDVIREQISKDMKVIIGFNLITKANWHFNVRNQSWSGY